MLRRCSDPNRKDYHRYGGRGISVCNRWSGDGGFKNFVDDLYPSFREGLEIDRVDNDGNYEPSNVKWSTRQEQILNSDRSGCSGEPNYLEYNGKSLHLNAWASEVSIPASVLSDRISKLKWSVKDTLETRPRPKRIQLERDGVTYQPHDIFKSTLYVKAKELGVDTIQIMSSLYEYDTIAEYHGEKYVIPKSDKYRDIVLKLVKRGVL